MPFRAYSTLIQHYKRYSLISDNIQPPKAFIYIFLHSLYSIHIRFDVGLTWIYVDRSSTSPAVDYRLFLPVLLFWGCIHSIKWRDPFENQTIAQHRSHKKEREREEEEERTTRYRSYTSVRNCLHTGTQKDKLCGSDSPVYNRFRRVHKRTGKIRVADPVVSNSRTRLLNDTGMTEN